MSETESQTSLNMRARALGALEIYLHQLPSGVWRYGIHPAPPLTPEILETARPTSPIATPQELTDLKYFIEAWNKWHEIGRRVSPKRARAEQKQRLLEWQLKKDAGDDAPDPRVDEAGIFEDLLARSKHAKRQRIEFSRAARPVAQAILGRYLGHLRTVLARLEDETIATAAKYGWPCDFHPSPAQSAVWAHMRAIESAHAMLAGERDLSLSGNPEAPNRVFVAFSDADPSQFIAEIPQEFLPLPGAGMRIQQRLARLQKLLPPPPPPPPFVRGHFKLDAEKPEPEAPLEDVMRAAKADAPPKPKPRKR
jgi:hypothetical protein